MNEVDLIFKYRKVIERMCRIKIKYYAVNDLWYEIREVNANG